MTAWKNVVASSTSTALESSGSINCFLVVEVVSFFVTSVGVSALSCTERLFCLAKFSRLLEMMVVMWFANLLHGYWLDHESGSSCYELYYKPCRAVFDGSVRTMRRTLLSECVRLARRKSLMLGDNFLIVSSTDCLVISVSTMSVDSN